MKPSLASRLALRPSWPAASLRTYLVAVILLATVPIAVLMSVQLLNEIKAQEARASLELNDAADALAQTVARELSATVDTLTLLADTDALQRDDAATFQRLVHERGWMRASWRSVELTAVQGEPRFERQIDGRLSMLSGRLADAGGAPATAVRVPVRSTSGRHYVLTAWIAARTWQDMLERIGAPPGGHASLSDATHLEIAHLGPLEAIDQDPVYDSTRSLPGGWTVEAGVPSAPLAEAHRTAIARALGTAAACMLLGVSLALLAARRITRPLQDLATSGPSKPMGRIAVHEIALLRDALLAAEAQDAVARARLQNKADEFETLFTVSPVALAFAQDPQCRVVMHNDAMSELFGPGTTGEPQAASSALGVMHRGQPLPQHEMPLQRAAATGQAVQPMELELLRADSAPRVVVAQAVPLLDAQGRPRGAIGAAVDITARKEADRERLAFVEREQAARRDAEAASRAKDEFLAMLGHELRNPLSAISSAVEVLNRLDANAPAALSARTIIARQTRLLSHVMDDLLDVARVISGKVSLSRQDADLAVVVRNAANTLELTGATKHHVLEFELHSVPVHVDTTRIEQVVNNLLTNALKYTPAGGRIRLVVREQDGQALLEVRDSGDGIAPELLPRIFDLFVQGERTLDRRAGGLGIGLTLVRHLVELHGGRVSVASSTQGAVFTVALPLAESVPPPPAPESWSSARQHRRVLVVEDNEDAVVALSSMLRLQGHSVWTAVDGVSGLDSLLSLRPDVAVIDIGLPGLTGFEVAQRSRAAGYPGRLIALSGYGQGRDVERALKAGFDAHLVKPVDNDRLRALLISD